MLDGVSDDPVALKGEVARVSLTVSRLRRTNLTDPYDRKQLRKTVRSLSESFDNLKNLRETQPESAYARLAAVGEEKEQGPLIAATRS